MATSIPVMTSQPVRHGKEGEARAAARRATAAEAKKSGVRVDQSQCKELGGIVYQACHSCLLKTDRANLKRCVRCQNVWYCSAYALGRVLAPMQQLIPHPGCVRRKTGRSTRRPAGRSTSPLRLSPPPQQRATSLSDVLPPSPATSAPPRFGGRFFTSANRTPSIQIIT